MESKKYKLVIVESPSKAKTIEKYLGSEYKVIASKGHILDLPLKSLGVNTDDFSTEIVPIPSKTQTIKDIFSASKNASEIYLASDPDREGEAIAFHLKKIIKRKDVKRVLFHSITKPAILEAIKNASELDEEKYDAQQARRILDRLIGYKISPIVCEKIQPGLSAGRVQSVTLKIIAEREKDILNFTPEKWFDIIADFKKEGISFNSKYIGKELNESFKIKSQKEADSILAQIKAKDYVVVSCDKKEKVINPQPPFTTSKLQQEASSKLKISTKDTMSIAQKLYEGIEVEGFGRTGLITYMRTDSVRSDPGAIEEARKLITLKFGESYLPKEAVMHKHKKTDSKVQDAHEAIRPANLSIPPSKVQKSLSTTEYQLYALIWNKFIASQMANAQTEVTSVILKVEQSLFRSNGSVLVFDGFKKLEALQNIDHGDNDKEPSLPKFEINESLRPTKEPSVLSKSSTPPPRFSEGTLVKELEDKGVGRPSTYSNIISNISGRNYVAKGKDDRFYPTPLGVQLCDFLELHFPVQMNIAFTSNTEELLDNIEEGKSKIKEILKDFWGHLDQALVKAKEVAGTCSGHSLKPLGEATGIKCLKCSDGEYLVKKITNDEFLSCSKYPDCKSTQKFTRSKKEGFKIVERFPKKYTEHNCKTCSKKMILISLPDKKFLSCEDYPSCKFSMPIPSKIQCPNCKDGRLNERSNKEGEPFVGCNDYPKCNFVSWNSKLKKCKHCEGNIQKSGKDKKKFCLSCKK